MYNVQYGTVSPRTMRDHGGDRIGDKRGQIADLDQRGGDVEKIDS